MTMEASLISAEGWAKTQKRVTNGSLRKRFDISEDIADEVYKILKQEGIVGRMGYVEADK
jgi:ribosomal protein S25